MSEDVVTESELRERVSELVDRAQAGEAVRITRDGAVVAELRRFEAEGLVPGTIPWFRANRVGDPSRPLEHSRRASSNARRGPLRLYPDANVILALLTFDSLTARAEAIWPADAAAVVVSDFAQAECAATWKLPHQRYAKPEHRPVRETIVAALLDRLDAPNDLTRLMVDSPDALDAVLAGFAAIAVVRAVAPPPPPDAPAGEGWIAVHP